ncbi:hypothetical protein BO221_06785 [Archangium sp. Cb G35]|uniref:PPC domain-containing protein n=1 Tax=Archangium sp. Cb G35 TaxID=1920190 RepID=UPI000936F6EC|nr:PPC domain-containing protein [Archangium sp. Cb G35]OJT25572.1 hypothetical protein BO221_06785 [Archangium sp. Cb G35]
MRIPCSRVPRRARVIGTLLCTLAFVGCGPLDEASAVPEQDTLTVNTSALTGSYTYSASNTSSAHQNTVNQVVALTAGQTLTVTTCGLPGATYTGDTYLRLIGPLGLQLASNDDACGGAGSSLTFTTSGGGNFEIRGGCYSSTSCTATVVWKISSIPPPTGGSYTFSATNTNNAQQNTVNQNISVVAGQKISVSTCDSTMDDTYLRLYGPSATQVAASDNGCFNGYASRLSFTSLTSGTYQIRAGCGYSYGCSGTVTWTVE